MTSSVKKKSGTDIAHANQVLVLDQLLQEFANGLDETAEADEVFELFCAHHWVSRTAELSISEIREGITDGTDDGQIDAAFVIVNGMLIRSVDELPGGSVANLSLVLLQSTTSESFKLEKLKSLHVTLRDIFDLNEDFRTLGEFRDGLVEKVELFRECYAALLKRNLTVSVDVAFASKGNANTLSKQFVTRQGRIQREISEVLQEEGSCRVTPLGAAGLVELAKDKPPYQGTLKGHGSPLVDKSNGFATLVRLDDYFDFVTDDNDEIREEILEENVRDWQGNVRVNEAIRGTLQNTESQFWWLNNGVTVLCERAKTNNLDFELTKPIVVNGLQTSREIYDHFSSGEVDDATASSLLLVKIIKTDDDEIRDSIIRATNSQTGVTEASLRATDAVQRHIEIGLKTYGWFYERRKNHYRLAGEPASKIVSVPQLAQVCLAIGHGKIDDARARPSKVFSNDRSYRSVFNSKVPIRAYAGMIECQAQVDRSLRMNQSVETADVTNFRFHVSTVVASRYLLRRPGNMKNLARLEGVEFADSMIASAFRTVKARAEKHGLANDMALDAVSKSPAFTEEILKMIAASIRRKTAEKT